MTHSPTLTARTPHLLLLRHPLCPPPPLDTTHGSLCDRDDRQPPSGPFISGSTLDKLDNNSSNRHNSSDSRNSSSRDASGRCTCQAARDGAAYLAACAVRACVTCKAVVAIAALTPLLLLRRSHRKHRANRQVPHVLVTLFLLIMLAGRSVASRWIEESPHSVKLRAQFCRPVSEEHLKSMLGAAFDSSMMSNLDPSAAKRGDAEMLDPDALEGHLDTYYMEDDPNAGGYFDEDIVDIVTEREGDSGWIREEEEEEDFVEEKDDYGARQQEEEGGLHNKKGLESPSADREVYQQRDRDQGRGQGRDQGQNDQSQGQLYKYMYMRRRRRATSQEAGSTEDSTKRDKKGKDSLLPLRLLLSGKNRKLRRKLKKVFRKKAKKLANKPPPWECELKKVWGRLKEGYFPHFLLDGRCMTDKCFYRLYDCVPQQYPVKVLKRDPDYCNPLPTIGANTTYEQRWNIVRFYVTVGCKCSTSDPKQRLLGRLRKS